MKSGRKKNLKNARSKKETWGGETGLSKRRDEAWGIKKKQKGGL